MGPAWLWLWLLGAGILASAGGDASPGPSQEPSGPLSEPAPAYHQITPGITSFALRLYKQLAAGTRGNIFFSPVSISTTLALLSLGVPADTSTQILEGLGFNLTETPQASIHQGFQSLLRALSLPSPKLEMKVGNSLFLDKQLKPQQRFLDNIRELYGALAFSANFTNSATTRRDINGYIGKQTYGEVVDSLQEFNEDTLMVLLNYIFFKAKWKQPFHRYHTLKQESSVNKMRIFLNPMMYQRAMYRFLHDDEVACTVVQLEYSGNTLAMMILPDPGRIEQVEEMLQPETLRKWEQMFRPSSLELHLPRISISGTYDLGEILSHIGLTDTFKLEADLLGITGEPQRTISRVSHKATMTMGERGIIAGAASGLLFQPQALNVTSAPLGHFSSSFLVLLWEMTTHSLLFLGRVANPNAG